MSIRLPIRCVLELRSKPTPDSPNGEPRVIWTEGDPNDCVEV